MSLEQRALEWIDPYWNAEHLVRTRDWARELEPGAGEALVLAALTHDMERHFPGGPPLDVATQPPDGRAYREAHSERSARIVGEWLRAQEDAAAELVEAVEELILLHEWGGYHAADVLQAADSISFLEVNDKLVACWARKGPPSTARAADPFWRISERIRLPSAEEPWLRSFPPAGPLGQGRTCAPP